MKKYAPHLIAVVIFLLLTYLYNAPLFNDKELRQSDINNWKGMSKELLDYKDKTGDQSFWTNSMFGGMPAYQITVEYTGNFLRFLDKIFTLWLPVPANYFFLLMAGFYFLLITMRIDYKVALLGAVGFAFSSYFILFVVTGHNSKAHAIAYMAPVIAGIIITYRGRLLLGAALTAIFLSLELYANHLQITYYLMLIIVIYAIIEFYSAIREKRMSNFIKASGLLAIGAILAVMSNITNIMATQEYGEQSTRGPSELSVNKENQTSGLDRDYITDWSFTKDETFTLLIPNYKGGASEAISKSSKDALKNVDSNFRQYVANFSSYFGDQAFTGGPVYAGAIIVLLFMIGAFVVRGPLKWWLVSATILSLLLSWGKNLMWFTNLFLDFIPGYDKFRAVTTTIVIAEFTMPLLGIIAVSKMISEKNFFAENKKRLMYAMGIVMFFTLVIAMKPDLFGSFYTQHEYDQVAESVKDQGNSSEILDQFFDAVSTARKSIVVSDAMRSFFFILLASGLIYTFLRYRYRSEILVYGLLVLVAIDLISVDWRYMNADDFISKNANKIPFPESQADMAIKQDNSPSYRVLNLAVNTFNDASTSYYHQSVGGYHGAKLKRYKELIDYNLLPEVSTLRSILSKPNPANQALIYSQPAINMLNTKYLIINPDAAPLVNQGALGNAWFVTETKMVANADSEIAAINNFDPAHVAVVDVRFKDYLNGFHFSPDSAASIKLTDYKPNHLTYKTSASAEQLAVFSEIYYDKGWNAYVDGVKTNHIRVDYVLRAMRVPAGNHTIEFKFEPEVVTKGEKISVAGTSLIVLLALVALFFEFRKKRDTAAQA
jgi:hypothetical protein